MITSLQIKHEKPRENLFFFLEERFHALATCQIWFWGTNRSHQGIGAWFSLDILDYAFSYFWIFENAYHKKNIDIFVYKHLNLQYKTNAYWTNSDALYL